MRVSIIAPHIGRNSESIIQPGWEGERNYGARLVGKEKSDEVYSRGKTGEEKKGRHNIRSK